ncbi:hypothetical protein IWW37_000332 [Coemansia sp. RSA 2050]|nr:hypothetical protein IWW37_000332 [Coemansia sp. RSA 2050]KAJ2736759.1 hypothetical protein IW152_000513 [Coemansia sp. BCRC 34962]
MSALPHTLTLKVPFADARLAGIAKRSLMVDRELSEGKVSRKIGTQDSMLIATFSADTLRMLRVSVNGFMDSLILVSKTLDAFA